MMTAPLMMRVAFAVAGMDAVGVDHHLEGDFFNRCLEIVKVGGVESFVSPSLSVLKEFTHLESGPCVNEALKNIICDD